MGKCGSTHMICDGQRFHCVVIFYDKDDPRHILTDGFYISFPKDTETRTATILWLPKSEELRKLK